MLFLTLSSHSTNSTYFIHSTYSNLATGLLILVCIFAFTPILGPMGLLGCPHMDRLQWLVFAILRTLLVGQIDVGYGSASCSVFSYPFHMLVGRNLVCLLQPAVLHVDLRQLGIQLRSQLYLH